MRKVVDDEVARGAAENRAGAERALDSLAEGLRRDGESFESAYSRVLDTELGRGLVRTLDDAQELERGGPTSKRVAEAHAGLARGR